MTEDDREFCGSLAGLCFICCILILVLAVLSGCAVPVEHRVPQLDEAVKALQKPTCQPLMPIPARMLIDIDGTKATADMDGEIFLRRYVATRDCLRGAQ